MRHGLLVANVGTYADPRNVVRIAEAAQASGWEALLVWDHLAFVWGPPAADPWVTLGAVAHLYVPPADWDGGHAGRPAPPARAGPFRRDARRPQRRPSRVRCRPRRRCVRVWSVRRGRRREAEGREAGRRARPAPAALGGGARRTPRSPLLHRRGRPRAAASPNTLWPPNHKFRLVTLAGATDPDGDEVTLTITGVTQDEPVNGAGDGNTSPDAQPGALPNTVRLRAERRGAGDGRVYRIAFTVSDGQGGSCSGTVKVGVPHDMGAGSTPIDSAPPSFNSFGS